MVKTVAKKTKPEEGLTVQERKNLQGIKKRFKKGLEYLSKV